MHPFLRGRRAFLSLLAGLTAVAGINRPLAARAATTKTVTTVRVPDAAGTFALLLATGAQVLEVSERGVSVLADPTATPITRHFVLVRDGGTVVDNDTNNGLIAHGSFVVPSTADGDRVLHLFEVL